MSVKAIRAALESAVATWAAAQTPAVPVQYQNVAYTPAIGTRYLRTFTIPAETENPSLGDAHRRYTGILQANLYMPDGNGSGTGETLADSLLTYFARGESFTISGVTVRILQSPSVNPALNDNGWYIVPVAIRYQADIF